MKTLFEYLISKENKKRVHIDPEKYYDDLRIKWEASIEKSLGAKSIEEYVDDETGNICPCVYTSAENIKSLIKHISNRDIRKCVDYESGKEYNKSPNTLGGRAWFNFIEVSHLMVKHGLSPKKEFETWLKILTLPS